MTGAASADCEPSLADVREYLLSELNAALRRPGMHGGEITIQVYLDAVAYTYGHTRFINGEKSSLQAAGAFLPTGVSGAFERLWGIASDDMAASVYAELSWRHGWLRPDQIMSSTDYTHLAASGPDWCARDRGLSDILATFGPASVSMGPSQGPRTLTYLTQSRNQPCMSFHLWNEPAAKHNGRQYSEPQLLALRRESDSFENSFAFTPLGSACTRRAR